MALSSSSSSSIWKFAVFLSFRGVDTRKNFVSFLYKELVRNGIQTFKDDEELESGKSISPELLQAIEDSKFAIVVMSENYASSGWCLEELSKIMECHSEGRLTAIPVFYEVEPWHVRRQKGKFEEHLKKHEEREIPEKVKRWKEALKKLANLSGKNSKDWKDDSDLVDNIVNDVLKRFISATPSDFSGLVGMEARMKALYQLLDLESNNEVRVIGIWGMGGIGKTTLATYAYAQISRHFQISYFLNGVRKIYQESGPLRLLEELLPKAQGRSLMVNSPYIGLNAIKSRLGHQKVLLVADDVDKIEQLDALAVWPSHFGPGSRVIVTTRDKHLLDDRRVKYVHKVDCLNSSESFQLFCQYAFRGETSLTGFENLSRRAVSLAGHLPLALRVFGSFLSGRAKEDWEIALDKLERSANGDIMEVLKISYVGLDEETKSIFLRIAIFFNYRYVDDVISLVDGDNVEHARFGIKVLVERSLMDLVGGDIVLKDKSTRIVMHDLVRQMGRELAGHESNKRRILCKLDEISDVLTNKSGTNSIEGISLDMSDISEEKYLMLEKAFRKMQNLKYVHVYEPYDMEETRVFLSDGIIFRKLKCLSWEGYPSKTFQLISAECLVELVLSYSMLEKFWDGSPCLRSLKQLDFSDSFNLKEFPNLSNAPNLEYVRADGCRKLIEIPSSINCLNKLVELSLCRCDRLERLPNNINMESLEDVRLYRSVFIRFFPQFSRGIKKITVDGKNRKELPESIRYLSHLVELEVSGFLQLEHFSIKMGDLTSLKNLTILDCPKLRRITKEIGSLSSLRRLRIFDCPRLQKIPKEIGSLSSLYKLEICNCPRLQKVPKEIGSLSSLYRLAIYDCRRLQKFPKEIGSLSSLQELFVENCPRLQEIPKELGCLSCLQFLSLAGCHMLQSSPETMENLAILETQAKEEVKYWGEKNATTRKRSYQSGTKEIESISLDISDEAEEDDELIRVVLPDGVQFVALRFKYLRWQCYSWRTMLQFGAEWFVEIHIGGCMLEKLWDGSPCLRNLKTLYFPRSYNLKEFPNLSNAQNLEDINASGCSNLTEIPSTINCLNKLVRLHLGDCSRLERLPNKMDMESLEYVELIGSDTIRFFPRFSRGIKRITIGGEKQREVPESIRYLSHLVSLEIRDFSQLEHLSTIIGDLTSLEQLKIFNCPKLRRIPKEIGKLTSLRNIELNSCSRLRRIPKEVGNLASLQEVKLIHCPRLRRIPETIANLVTHQEICPKDFGAVRRGPENIRGEKIDASKKRSYQSKDKEIFVDKEREKQEPPNKKGKLLKVQ